MSDPTTLAGDLREYFAATTTAAMPRRVAEMSARTLPSRRGRPVRTWFTASTGALAAAALVFLVATHIPRGGSGAALSSSAAAPTSEQGYGAQADGVVVYPGVDTAALADRGVRLLAPAGHGTATLTPPQAQAAARAGAGTTAGVAGPAVLVFAGVSDRGPAFSCLCWAVDVPVGAGNAGTTPGGHTELVLIDAASGRVEALVTGPGVP